MDAVQLQGRTHRGVRACRRHQRPPASLGRTQALGSFTRSAKRSNARKRNRSSPSIERKATVGSAPITKSTVSPPTETRTPVFSGSAAVPKKPSTSPRIRSDNEHGRPVDRLNRGGVALGLEQQAVRSRVRASLEPRVCLGDRAEDALRRTVAPGGIGGRREQAW